MPWIIDGMNVIGSRPDGWWTDREGAMARLVDLLGRWAAQAGDEVTVVFEQRPARAIAQCAVEVAHPERPGRDAADDEIVRRVASDPAPEDIRVVTSDRRLADRVRAEGASAEPAGAFRAQLERAR